MTFGKALLFCCASALVAGASAAAARPAAGQGRDLLNSRRGVALSTPSGMEVEVSQKLLDYGATILNTLIATELSKVTIPEISGEKDGFNYDVSNCHLTASIASPSAGFVAGAGLSLALDGVNLHANCDWSYKLHDWPHVPDGSGSLDATAGGSTSVTATVDAAIVGGKVVLTVSQCSVNIDDFDISVHGSIFSWLYDLIVDAFKGDIKNDISSAAQGAIKSVVETTLNQELASLALQLDIPFPAPFNIAEIDFTITDIAVGADSIAVGTRSSVNNTATPTADPYPVAPLPLPPSTPATRDASMVTLTLSQWPINNGFWVFSEAGLLQYPITAAEVPPSFPIQLNTDAFDDVAPGLAKAYPSTTMGLLLAVPKGFTEVAKIVDDQGIVVSALPLQFNFSVYPNNGTTPTAAFSLQCPAAAVANASVNTTGGAAQVIYLDVASLTCTPLSVIASAFGNVTTDGLDLLVDGLLTGLLLPDINKFLGGGFALPSIDGVSLTSSSITPTNGSLMISSDIAWDPSTFRAAKAAEAAEAAVAAHHHKQPHRLGQPAAFK